MHHTFSIICTARFEFLPMTTKNINLNRCNQVIKTVFDRDSWGYKSRTGCRFPGIKNLFFQIVIAEDRSPCSKEINLRRIEKHQHGKLSCFRPVLGVGFCGECYILSDRRFQTEYAQIKLRPNKNEKLRGCKARSHLYLLNS